MIKLVEEHINDIQSLCKTHFVKKLYLFGSALNKEFSSKSDIDFLYEIDSETLRKSSSKVDYASNLFQFQENLQIALGRKIDLVRHNFKTPNHFIQAIGNNKKLLYAGE